jgi:2-succinyl-6-hydroxy-2,4-cyclohexadiene-1-carboxylate synthase
MAPHVVLLHGFTQTGASWRPVVDALEGRLDARAPDLRGHGAARAVRPIAFEACVRDAASLVDGPFGLAGYSMGGRVALHVALAHPERVRRLVLIGATAGIEDDAERAVRRTADLALADAIDASTIEAFADRWAAQPLLAGQPAAVRAAVRADRLRNAPDGLAAALRGIGTGAMAPLWDRLGELAMPVALVAGERDAKFRAIAERMAERIRDAELPVISGAGHAAHLEAPERVAALL